MTDFEPSSTATLHDSSHGDRVRRRFSCIRYGGSAKPATYDEIDTLVQSRRLAHQIVREHEATLPIAGAPAMLRKTTATRPKRTRKRKARSHLHWAVLAMAIAIACGLWRDPVARTNAKRQLTTETQHIAKTASAKLGTATSAALAKAKRVSARII